MASRMAWFGTAAGKRVIRVAMGSTALLAFSAQYTPNTVFLSQYKSIVSMYSQAVPHPLAENIKKLFYQVIHDLNLEEEEAKRLDPFTVFGFDVFHAGSTSSRYGAIIGIPINFTYKTWTDMDRDKFRVNGELADWSNPDVTTLAKSLVLTEDAKLYAIAREISDSRYGVHIFLSALNCISVASNFILCILVKKRYNLLSRPTYIRHLTYGACTLVSFILWALQKDFINVAAEKLTDDTISKLPEAYSKGAIDFYTNMLTRNAALYKLLGNMGPWLYEPSGLERVYFRKKTCPIDYRIKFFETRLNERAKNEELKVKEAEPQPKAKEAKAS